MSSKFRACSLSLQAPLPRPPLDLIRARAEALCPDPTSEIPALLHLFHPEFPETGYTEIPALQARAVVRACSRLMLEFRARDLAAITDAQLESDYLYTAEALKDQAVLSYLPSLYPPPGTRRCE